MGASETVSDVWYSTQMYVEAEAKMDTYQAQDGSNRTALNLLQRTYFYPSLNSNPLAVAITVLMASQATSKPFRGLRPATHTQAQQQVPNRMLKRPKSHSVASAHRDVWRRMHTLRGHTQVHNYGDEHADDWSDEQIV